MSIDGAGARGPDGTADHKRDAGLAPAVAAVRPLIAARLADLEALSAGKGCSFARGCWCLEYREAGRPALPEGVTRADHRREALRTLAAGPTAPGLIAYAAGRQPVGWVAAGPRYDFSRLRRSRVMAPVDDQPVWSVVCFVMPSRWRGRGVASVLLWHAVQRGPHR